MPLDALHHSSARLKSDARIASLGDPLRVWTIGGIYGRFGALCRAHEALFKAVRPRDRIVYLGNYLGPHSLWGGEGAAVLDELILFRSAIMARPGFFASDVVFLKGAGEDLLQQALRMPFQKNVSLWLPDALARGLECYTSLYGGTADELHCISQMGVIAQNRFSHHLLENIQSHVAHGDFFATLKSAARTEPKRAADSIALVPAGLDPTCPLTLQYEALCWPQRDIADLAAYPPFARLVRGQALRNEAPDKNRFVLTLDDGQGLGGTLHAACLDGHGRVLELLNF